jgi:hypothetical protein
MFVRSESCSAEEATRLQTDVTPKKASSCKLDGNRLFLIQAAVLWAVLVVPTVGVAAALYLAQFTNRREQEPSLNATSDDLGNRYVRRVQHLDTVGLFYLLL